MISLPIFARFLRLPASVALLLAVGGAAAQNPFICEDQFFLTLVQPPTSLNEVVINEQNNVVFQNINNNIGIDINAAGYRSTDNYIYCIAPATRRLVRLDANGKAEILASLPLNPRLAYFAGDVTPDGKYLVVIGTVTYSTGLSEAAEMVRIDLESGSYNAAQIPMKTTALVYDIAFSPITGQLYGYDSRGRRLVRINSETGDVTFPFEPAGEPGITGSMFFDAFGNLFVYGGVSTFSEVQNRLYELDTRNGKSRLLTTGASASSSDGCSCPYTVQLSKTVNMEQSLPCSEIEYTFTIANTSGRTQTGLRLEDQLPPGFSFMRMQSLSLNGRLVSLEGDQRFILDDLSIPVGTHEVKIIVNVGNVREGLYRNQAVLYNLPASLGKTRISDNPATLIKGDSTEISITRPSVSSFAADTTLCANNAFVRLDISPYAAQWGNQVSYLWSDGSVGPLFDVRAPGVYRASIIAGCDTIPFVYTVRGSGIEVSLNGDEFTIELGDSLLLSASAYNFNAEQAIFQWRDPQPGSLRCPTCADSWAQPFNDIRYTVEAKNEWGCRDTANLRVKVLKNRNIYFPNVIKPAAEAEASNAYFFASGAAGARLSRLAVYSRWGELVFETRATALNDPATGWDGTYRNQAVLPGVYTWVAQVSFLDGEQAQYAGDVTVVR